MRTGAGSTEAHTTWRARQLIAEQVGQLGNPFDLFEIVNRFEDFRHSAFGQHRFWHQGVILRFDVAPLDASRSGAFRSIHSAAETLTGASDDCHGCSPRPLKAHRCRHGVLHNQSNEAPNHRALDHCRFSVRPYGRPGADLPDDLSVNFSGAAIPALSIARVEVNERGARR